MAPPTALAGAAVAGIFFVLIETTTTPILCDELAAPSRHLLRCGDDVHAP